MLSLENQTFSLKEIRPPVRRKQQVTTFCLAADQLLALYYLQPQGKNNNQFGVGKDGETTIK